MWQETGRHSDSLQLMFETLIKAFFFTSFLWILRGFCGGSDGKESAFNARDPDSFDPWVGKIPWRREWLPIPVFLPREFHGQRSLVIGFLASLYICTFFCSSSPRSERSLVGCSPWGH